MSGGECFFMGFLSATMILVIIGLFLLVRSNTEISQDIIRNIQQSTNIVETLKGENLIIRNVRGGLENDTVELIVEYDFLYKSSKKNNN